MLTLSKLLSKLKQLWFRLLLISNKAKEDAMNEKMDKSQTREQIVKDLESVLEELKGDGGQPPSVVSRDRLKQLQESLEKLAQSVPHLGSW